MIKLPWVKNPEQRQEIETTYKQCYYKIIMKSDVINNIDYVKYVETKA